ncbi:MAG: tetratricopeptide repeat protein [Prevotella sp.]|nr:tetratricopeptide repeat protein [Prevotella sp.]
MKRANRHQKTRNTQAAKTRHGGWVLMLLSVSMLIIGACSTKNNTAKTRWWHSFNARYNTYYNGSLAFIDGYEEKEKANQDNYTEVIPLNMVGNKNSVNLGRANFDRAIEKSEKAIKLHSIKRRPVWTKNRRKTAKDIEWLNRKEYNPFLWKAWLMMGKSQFQTGRFDEAAATFSYMSRLYATQPAINGIARAWLTKCYVELGWLYDAEDVITKMKRDTMHYKAKTDWDYAMASYHVKAQHYQEAIPYLRKVIKHEKRKKQKARQWFLMGQMQAILGNKDEAYKAFRHVVRLNPPYQLDFNARIAQTEVMDGSQWKQKIRRLKRMAASDNNKEYLDQVYYAMGNVYLSRKDTANAIGAYEKGVKKATRTGVEKGVLLLHLGDIYWEMEKYSDAKRCYGEAIGLLDRERKDYAILSERSKVLDELVPYTEAVYLQDSLQVLATLPESERNKAIDRVIEELKKKEKEEKRAAQEAEAEKILQQQGAVGNRNNTKNNTANTPQNNKQTTWYFYNQMAVNQGKTLFQQQWGKRENVDDWQRINKTVVNMGGGDDEVVAADSTMAGEGMTGEMTQTEEGQEGKEEVADSAANDPHERAYYLAQIPFTEEQKAESDNIIKDGLFYAGIIFKDKLNNLKMGEKTLMRLTTQYADYEKNDEAWYHLFLLYSRLGQQEKAEACLAHLQNDYPESQWTILLSDPYFEENSRFGVHIEDSLYAATYEAFKANRFDELKGNVKLSTERFPLGAHRPKFIFVEGLTLLNEGDSKGCLERMKTVVEKYAESEVATMAGMIVKGVQEGRMLHQGRFDIGDVWSRRSSDMSDNDSVTTDTLSIERNTNYLFLIASQTDSVNVNQMLYELAKYNFTNFLVRNFDITTDEENGISRMMVSGFLSYDEALQYARRLYDNNEMMSMLRKCRHLIISEHNLKLIGTKYSYNDYESFYEEKLAPIPVSDDELLNSQRPTDIVSDEEETEKTEDENGEEAPVELEQETDNQNVDIDFDEDFYR